MGSVRVPVRDCLEAGEEKSAEEDMMSESCKRVKSQGESCSWAEIATKEHIDQLSVGRLVGRIGYPSVTH